MTDRHAWIEEGAHAVAPGVHRIPLPLPSDALRAVNVYAIETGSSLVLVDSGWALANAQDQLERSLALIGAGLRDISKFLVTHMHRDHYTQAVQLRRIFGTPVALGLEEKHSIDTLLDTQYEPFAAQLEMLSVAGAAPIAAQLSELLNTAGMGARPDHPALLPGDTFGATIGYERPDEWIAAGQQFELGTRTLTAIATPGHTRGHVVFADTAAGLLFAGDHVLPHITPSIGFEEAPPELPLGDYLQSLSVVRQLPDMRLLPAHGPVAPSTHARVDELADHHARRLQAMADVLSGGERSGYEVAQAIGWTSRQRPLADFDLMNQMLAIGETVYHLDLLVARSQAVSRSCDDGARRYQLASPPLDEEITA